jgi:hypothetical protein
LDLLKELLIYSNVFVSLCVAALTSVTFIIYGIQDLRIILLSFFSTLTYYNFLRLFKWKEYEKGLSPLSRWILNHRIVTLSLGLLGLLASAYLISSYSWRDWMAFVPLFGLALLYTLPLRIKGRVIQLRAVPGLKIFLIAFMWTFATIRLPLALAGALEQQDLILMDLARFSFILAITIPFDIRDLAYDSPQLKTLPQQFGVHGSKRIALLALLLFVTISALLFQRAILSSEEMIATLVVSIMAAAGIWVSGKGRGEWFYGFFIEGLSLAYFLLILLIYSI